ncbi:MAG: archease [Desulfobacterales bacterium]|nr:archease [Desulfobacterales bacterium]
MKYRILDHTADFGIQVFGQSAQEVFIQAAYAMMEQIVNRKALEVKFENQLVIEGFDWPDLMVNWLRELLFLWSGNELLMKRALINTLSPNRLSAVLKLDVYSAKRHVIKNEIKAITYHELQVKQTVAGWQAQFICDV